jgi:hypothetical protein
MKQEVLGKTNSLLYLIWNGTPLTISRCRGNGFTEPLLNIHIQTHRLMRGIYDVAV